MSVFFSTDFYPFDLVDLTNITPWIAEGSVYPSYNDFYGDQSQWSLRMYQEGTDSLPWAVQYNFAAKENLTALNFSINCYLPEAQNWDLNYKIDDVWQNSGLTLESYCTESAIFTPVNADLTGLGLISGIGFSGINSATAAFDISNLEILETDSGFTSTQGSAIIFDLADSFANSINSLLPLILSLIIGYSFVKWVFLKLVDFFKR